MTKISIGTANPPPLTPIPSEGDPPQGDGAEWFDIMSALLLMDTKTLIRIATSVLDANIYIAELPYALVEAAHRELYRKEMTIRGLRWMSDGKGRKG